MEEQEKERGIEITRKQSPNIGIIGHVDHGKTTLTAAYLAAQKIVIPFVQAIEEKLVDEKVIETIKKSEINLDLIYYNKENNSLILGEDLDNIPRFATTTSIPYKKYRRGEEFDSDCKTLVEYHDSDDIYGTRKKKSRKQNNRKIKKRKKAKNGRSGK